MRDAQPNTIYLKDYQAPSFFIDETFLSFDIHEEYCVVSAQLTMRRNLAVSSANELKLDGEQLELLELKIDDEILEAHHYTVSDEALLIHQVPQSFVLSTRTKIYPHKNTALQGLYKSRKMFCTQCEAEGFRRITYYLDRPDVLSIFSVEIKADKRRYPMLLSNGEKQQQQELDDGRHQVRWYDPFKKPSYLFALVAADLETVEDVFTTQSGRVVRLQIFVEHKDLNKCAHAMRSLKAAMQWDEQVYGREYDLNRYMIVAVDDFNAGAMENKGLNIFNTAAILANPATTTDASFQRVEGVVAHEYFHNWSGNRVTCRDWFQLSLKEGFTVYRDAEFSADMNSRGVKRIESVNFLRSYQFPEDAGPTAHPIRPASYAEISNFYTVTVYEKGAEVVRMLANILGEQKFRRATDLYFERFDGQAVTCDDFVDVMQEVLGQDLKQFKNWYSQAGTPQLNVQAEYDATQQRYTLQIEQFCPATAETPEGEHKQAFMIPIVCALVTADGEITCSYNQHSAVQHTLLLTQQKQSFVFDNVAEAPTPSLLRGFSAPVKLAFDFSPQQLLLLWKHDSDAYARWDAGQQLAVSALQNVIHALREQRTPSVDQQLLEGMQFLIQRIDDEDAALLAEMLTLPNETYLAGHYAAGDVDVHAIYQGRQWVLKHIARELDWEQVYQYYQQQLSGLDYQPEAQQIGMRRMKNLALAYLLHRSDQQGVALAHQQFIEARNMTDAIASLRALVHSEARAATAITPQLLDAFYQQWQDESLVVNLWLQIQASRPQSGALQQVQQLMTHPAFDVNNPNKVRAVIGVFANANTPNFHADDGAGYQFLAQQIIALDRTNPQMAARLMTPLSRWRNYVPKNAQLMRQQLQYLADKVQSKDVLEQLHKSL